MKLKDLFLRLVIAGLVIGGYYYLNLKYPIVENIMIHLGIFAGLFLLNLLFFRYNLKNLGYGILIGQFIIVGASIIYVFTLLINKI